MSKRLRDHTLIFLMYLLVMLIVTWPAVTQIGTHLIGSSLSDSPEVARHIWWFKYALQNGLDPFNQTYLNYPVGLDGRVFLSVPLYVVPMLLLAFILPLTVAYNVTVLLTMALNGWAMHVLARHLTGGNVWAAWIGGLVYMLFPAFQGHLAAGHAGLIVGWAVPLYVLALLRLISAPRLWGRWLWLAILFFWLSPMGHILQAVYVLLPLTACLILARFWVRDWLGAWRVIVASGVGALVTLIYLLPVITHTLNESAYSDSGGYVLYSADLLGIISPSFFHPVYDSLFQYSRRVLGTNLTEGATYAGFFVLSLTVFAFARQPKSRWWVLVIGVAWVLSLGPVIKILSWVLTVTIDGQPFTVAFPWAGMYNLPGFNLARTPGRFAFTLALAFAALSAYGALVLLSRPNLRRGAVIGVTGFLSALIMFDYQTFAPMPTIPAEIPVEVTAIATRDDVRAVFNVPQSNQLAVKDGLLLQTAHQKPLVAGHITRSTPVSPAKLNILELFEPALLDEAGADVIILHKTRMPAEQLAQYENRLTEINATRLYADDRIALYEAPATTAQPAVTVIAPESTDNQRVDVYAYVPAVGWYDITATLSADNRAIDLLLDTVTIEPLTVSGEATISRRLPFNEAGYHVIGLALSPPCPPEYDETLTCRDLTVRDVTLTPAAEFKAGVTFAGGIELRGYAEPELADDILIQPLWWVFGQARTAQDVRFVHVVDASGQVVAQEDIPLGDFAAESHRAETVRLDVSGLSAGEYVVRVGWYAYADDALTPYPLLNPEPATDANALTIGAFTVP